MDKDSPNMLISVLWADVNVWLINRVQVGGNK